MNTTEIIQIWTGGILFFCSVIIVSLLFWSFFVFLPLVINLSFKRTAGTSIKTGWETQSTNAQISKQNNLRNEQECEIRKKSVQNESDAAAYSKVCPEEPKSDLWRPNESRIAYEPRVVPQPSIGSQLNALKDVQIAQVQVLKDTQKNLQELRNDLKSVGIQNENLFDNLNWEMQALREQEVNVNVTKRENEKFRHWTETRRYH